MRGAWLYETQPYSICPLLPLSRTFCARHTAYLLVTRHEDLNSCCNHSIFAVFLFLYVTVLVVFLFFFLAQLTQQGTEYNCERSCLERQSTWQLNLAIKGCQYCGVRRSDDEYFCFQSNFSQLFHRPCLQLVLKWAIVHPQGVHLAARGYISGSLILILYRRKTETSPFTPVSAVRL